jgi:hypothetical protein
MLQSAGRKQARESVEMRKARRAVLCVTLVAAAACDDSPAAPSAHVDGAWDFTFSAFDPRSCAVPAGLVPGCAGSGRLEFRPNAAGEATHSYRASCQSCGGAAEYGVVAQPLRTVRFAGDVVEFTLATCRFNASVPAAAPTITGTVACRPDPAGPEVSGSWTMARR